VGGGNRFFCGVGLFCGEGKLGAVGLGVSDELPLFKVCSCGEGFGISCCEGGLLFFCYSTL